MNIYEAKPYFLLDPHVDEYSPLTGLIPINVIAEEVYGKPFDSLRACQRDNEHLPNDSVEEYNLSEDYVYSDALAAFDDPEIYLGYDRTTGQSLVKTGVTPIEYWKSISWLPEGFDGEIITPEEIERYERLRGSEESSGFNRTVQGQHYNRWLAGEATLVHTNPKEGTDLEGAVFKNEFFAQRAYSPSLQLVLADLIRREVLPRGDYLFYHWW